MFNTEKLIELVKARRLLYDVYDEDYKNREKKAQAWLEISNEMGYQTGDYWILKWKSLKDNYTKFKKNKHTTAGKHYKYRNWPWAELMTFLDRPTIEVILQNTSQNSETASTSSDLIRKKNIDSEIASTSPEPIRKKKKISETASTSDDVQNKNEDIHPELQIKREAASPDPNAIPYIQSKTPNFDEVDLFFLSYAKNFKRLSPKCQALMKLEIASLFTRYELNEDSASQNIVQNARLYPFQSVSSVYSDSNRSNDENDDSSLH